MKRKSLAASVLALVLTAGAIVNAQSDSVRVDRAQVEEWQAQAQALADSLGDALETTTTTAAPTTTTRPPNTTTTTRPPNTTTTQPPTTTTTEPLPTPVGEYYNISVNNLDDLDPATHQWWVAPYFRNLPYVSNTGWVDGDRVGYRCAYGFLEWEGRLVGRFTFTRLDEAAYIQVNDKFMLEGIRYYDGTYDGPEDPRQLEDCPAPSQEYLPSTVDERPTVDFVTSDGRILERRDGYKPIVHPDLTFDVIDGGPDHDIGVVAMADGIPGLVVYYDSLVADVIIVSDIAP